MYSPAPVQSAYSNRLMLSGYTRGFGLSASGRSGNPKRD